MALPFSLVENLKVVQVLAPTVGTAPAVTTSAGVSLKLAHKAWIVCHISPVGGAAMTVAPQTDTLVALGTPAVLTSAVPIWMDANTSVGDALTRQANAVNQATAGDANPKMVIFEIDPAKLPAGEDCIGVSFGAVPVTDYVSAEIVIAPLYPAGVPFQPSVVVD